MQPTSPPSEADRIALRKMFKAIAEYGRRVRLRRQTEGDLVLQDIPVVPTPDRKRRSSRRKQKQRRRVTAK